MKTRKLVEAITKKKASVAKWPPEPAYGPPLGIKDFDDGHDYAKPPPSRKGGKLDLEPNIIKFIQTNERAKRYHLDMQDVKRAENDLREILAATPGSGLTLGGYAYYPKSGSTQWVASDGAELTSSMLSLILDYGGADTFIDFILAGPDGLADEFVIKKRVRQGDYEAGQMRGDHY
jgi:hypothetical protein